MIVSVMASIWQEEGCRVKKSHKRLQNYQQKQSL